MSNDPRFDSEFLEELALAFRKRRKALRHKATGAGYAKVYERIGDEKVERLEIHLPKHDGALLRLHAWPDRMIWLDARRSAKTGWAWSWTKEGRLLGTCSAVDAVQTLEATFDHLFEMTAAQVDELSEPWNALLAGGPRLVVQRGALR